MHLLRRSERGQAVTETMLLTWLLLLFIAMAWQLFIVNDTIFRSITAAHQVIFDKAEMRNCFTRNANKCKYTTDMAGSGARVIWSAPEVPEARLPIVGMFQSVLGQSVALRSNVRADGRKRTKIGSGTYQGVFKVLFCFSNSCIRS